jgi:hypothetical protein
LLLRQAVRIPVGGPRAEVVAGADELGDLADGRPFGVKLGTESGQFRAATAVTRVHRIPLVTIQTVLPVSVDPDDTTERATKDCLKCGSNRDFPSVGNFCLQISMTVVSPVVHSDQSRRHGTGTGSG